MPTYFFSFKMINIYEFLITVPILIFKDLQMFVLYSLSNILYIPKRNKLEKVKKSKK